MINRIVTQQIKDALNLNKVVSIIGPRQVGKSTLSEHIFKDTVNVLRINGDDTDAKYMFENVSENFLKILTANHNALLIDEAQKIKNIGEMLKIMADKLNHIPVIITGSSSFQLTKAVNESLTGRKREIQLLPISFAEMVKHTNIIEETRMLDHRLIYGYYPEVINNLGDEKDVLKELTNSYLYKDIMEENNIAKPDKLVKLLQALSWQIGSTVSTNELSQLVGIDAKTIDRYIDILQKNYIIYTLPSYANNLRNELKFSKKIYFYDMGIRNAIIGNMSPISMRQPEEVGHMWENFIITERIKRNLYNKRTFLQHYFWRTQQQKEVDLIEVEDGIITGFEIKRSAKKNIKAPAKFTEYYPNAQFYGINNTNLYEFLL
ncbi:MAG: ATP-binding protein [Paludibacteraceae bacterium]|nr:ATP-binding protein [Paludibacteraceae bacterium]